MMPVVIGVLRSRLVREIVEAVLMTLVASLRRLETRS